ncbi:Rhodanese-related sulfurtransferase [Hyunsoonleella jejuensis]|uniref:Rhodanese-related sulfurtransferase n=1 Tax=Hyunsoonleella jejuensis TaxID=419940 RepID=A0A1H9GVJ9_9FLAO|nr:rhodanese-like domain-containing protein [Hyunsoonleella jejuensis]SEQ54111.1 Rhodanese-related sulfurtransferase [Hyunsoonleella jejuensis]
MKKSVLFLATLFTMLAAIASGFSQEDNLATSTPDEFNTLVNYLESNTQFIKGEFPLITADELRKNFKNPKYQIVDIRTDSWFEYGHIKNAANVPAGELLNYFETSINPADFDKIVLICYSGQSAAYYSALLRLAGFDNVYSLKWGMSSWREDFANNAWTKNTKNSFAEQLETTVHTKPATGNHPVLATGKTEAKAILKTRLEELFAKPYKDFILKPDAVFTTPSDYFIVNYNNEEVYNNGHIPGAIHYKPGSSLLVDTDLTSLPINKKIALYTSTGQEAAYLVAYLSVLGYDMGNIAYGENGFMNEILKTKGWDAFSEKEINMFPVIE